MPAHKTACMCFESAIKEYCNILEIFAVYTNSFIFFAFKLKFLSQKKESGVTIGAAI